MLVCPSSKQALREVPLAVARDAVAGGSSLVPADRGSGPPAVGETPSVLLRDDGAVAFPVLDGTPILMWPEVLTSPTRPVTVDLRVPRYAEAYAEMGYYGDKASGHLADVTRTHIYEIVSRVARDEERGTFPEPAERWLDATYDCTAQERAYRYVAPKVAGATMVQVGGSGLQALKLVVAGVSEAVLVTPVLHEARLAARVAEELGLGDRFRSVVGVGEELPLAADTFDVALSGGCLHHMVTRDAGSELHRVLAAGGRFGAWDPWRAPLYRLGTAVLGKREPEVACRPIDEDRASAFAAGFGPQVEVERHGAVTRYPLIALSKAGVELKVGTTLPIFRCDDRLAGRRRLLRPLQSSVSICAEKPAS